MFGEVAFNAIGGLGLKEDSSEKAALKSIVGGIMSQIAGGSFTSGATSAGFNQLIMNELTKIKDPALLQWASVIIGATVSKLTGGDALTGGSITLSDIRNNFFNHLAQYIIDHAKDKIKGDVNTLIDKGIIPSDMKQDYYIYMDGISSPFKFVSGAAGYIVDKKGNVYGLFEADGGFGVATPLQITLGFGNFKAPKENSDDYISAIEGWSFGGGGAAGVQVTASVSTSGVISSEVTATTAMGTTLFAGRYVRYLFNLKND